MMKLVNLTPHEITIRCPGGELRIAPSGQVARVATTNLPCPELLAEGVTIPVIETVPLRVVGLPDPQDGVALIVSGMVLNAARIIHDRSDLYAPGDLVRDDKGRPIGCRGLRGRRC